MKLYYREGYPQAEILSIPLSDFKRVVELPAALIILEARVFAPGISWKFGSYDPFITAPGLQVDNTHLALKITSPFCVIAAPYTVLQFTELEYFLDRVRAMRHKPPPDWDEFIEPVYSPSV